MEDASQRLAVSLWPNGFRPSPSARVFGNPSRVVGYHNVEITRINKRNTTLWRQVLRAELLNALWWVWCPPEEQIKALLKTQHGARVCPNEVNLPLVQKKQLSQCTDRDNATHFYTPRVCLAGDMHKEQISVHSTYFDSFTFSRPLNCSILALYLIMPDDDRHILLLPAYPKQQLSSLSPLPLPSLPPRRHSCHLVYTEKNNVGGRGNCGKESTCDVS
ncbi:hypothetical protein EYF80_025592 [Liparis tanakae]|uniref:Uncharacterized protein n=1 Tax=Liparis tanakae TaxID=230148 RepID=A0A4Z2HH31_9TELE|nr:hypothetical protein EYF80_025592 [Liparis tanakae]